MKRFVCPIVLLAAGASLSPAATLYTGVDIGNATSVGTNTTNAYNSFVAALVGFNGPTDTDTLESIALTELVNIGTAHGVTITASCTSCDTSGTFSIKSGIQNTSDAQNGYASSGSKFYQVAGSEGGLPSVSQNTTLTLSFSTGIHAFGFVVTDVQSFLASDYHRLQ